MMLWTCYTQYASKFGKRSSAHRTGKRQFSFQSQRKAMPKNAQTTSQLHSSHARKVMFKILQARLQQYVNCEHLDVQARFRKGRGKTRHQRSNCQHPLDHRKSKRVPEKHVLCFIDYTIAFDCVDHSKLWNSLISYKIQTEGLTKSMLLWN